MAVGELVVVVDQARGVRGDATASALLTPLLRSHVHRWSATPADSSVRGRRSRPRPAEDPALKVRRRGAPAGRLHRPRRRSRWHDPGPSPAAKGLHRGASPVMQSTEGPSDLAAARWPSTHGWDDPVLSWLRQGHDAVTVHPALFGGAPRTTILARHSSRLCTQRCCRAPKGWGVQRRDGAAPAAGPENP